MIDIPLAFGDAISLLLDKEQAPAGWDAATWAAMESDVRVKSFWSAKVENARFLDRAQTALFDFMAKVTDVTTDSEGNLTTKLRVGGRAQFVDQMREFMVVEGMAKVDEFPNVNHDDVRDIRSNRRLNLIFDTNIEQAYGYGQWRQGMTPEAIKAFPGSRVVRVRSVAEPRSYHEENIGVVRSKGDPWWAEEMNSPRLGGFGVPWGPFGFGSGVNREDVSLAEMEALGLAPPPPSDPAEKLPDVVTGTKSSVKNLSASLKEKLREELDALMKQSGRKPTYSDADMIEVGIR